MGAAGTPQAGAGAAAAARGYTHQRERDRRPADRDRRRSAEHPLRRRARRFGKAVNGVHRSAAAVGSRRRRRHRAGRAVDAVHRRSRSAEAGDRADGRPADRRACACAVQHRRSPRRWRSATAMAGALRVDPEPRVRRPERRGEVSEAVPAGGRSRGARDGAQRQPAKARQTISALRALFAGAASDRRAEDAGPRHRRLRDRRQPGAPMSSSARLAAAARTSIYALKLDDQLFDITERARADRAVRRSPGAGRRARDARRRVARLAVQRHRHRRRALRPDRVGAVRLLPARRRIGRPRQGRQAAPDPRRRAAHGRDRAIAAAAAERRQRSAGAANAARGGRGRAELAAAVSALPLRVATFSLQGPEADKVQLLIHADVGTDYSASQVVVARLHHHRQRRPDRRQPGGRRAAAAGDERRAVGAAVHRRREPRRRATTR